jgi:biotin transport system substrate-specific component
MKLTTRDMILSALFAALTAVGAYITIPLPYIPLTLQVFFCILAGVILGATLGALSQLVYAIIGLLGVPVFAGGMGGITYVFKPSFGYIIGFIFAAYVIGKIVESYKTINFANLFLALLAGIIVIYFFGVSYMLLIVNLYLGKVMIISSAIKAGFTPFILADIVKAIFASFLAAQIIPALRRTGFYMSKSQS